MNSRRLAHRYQRKAEHFQAFAGLATILICHRRLTKANFDGAELNLMKLRDADMPEATFHVLPDRRTQF